MKVILKQDFEKLGNTGDIINVKDGYARNYLIPRQIAYEATSSNMKRFEEEKKRMASQLTKEVKKAEKMATELEKVSCTITVAVGEEDKLFGSVTSQDIAGALEEKGIAIDKRKILLEEPIKALGIYTVPIKLHSEVSANVKVWVVKK
jgi:large subunit ribosomal protein L9